MRDMNRSSARQLGPTAGLLRFFFVLCLAALLALAGCTAHADPAAEAPPPANIVPGADPALFTVDHPEQFPLLRPRWNVPTNLRVGGHRARLRRISLAMCR
jgi:hypothetical protein